MSVITFANTKGGAGKTTAVLLLSCELARRGFRVTVLDIDPQHWLLHWYKAAQPIANLSVVGFEAAASLSQMIMDASAASDMVIIDLPGDRVPALATALAFSDHVIVPIQGCAMDAKGGAQVLELLEEIETKAMISIPRSVVLTRVNSIVTTRAMLIIKTLLNERHVNVLSTPIVERAAYRDMFDHGLSVYDMDAAKVSNLDKAQINCRTFADDVLRLLPKQSATSRPLHGNA